MALALLVLLGGLRCHTCDAPDNTIYACQPLPADSTDPGCQGGPPALYTTSPTPNPDKVYPVGCAATLPQSNAAYGNSVVKCFCQLSPGSDGAAAPGWGCPI